MWPVQSIELPLVFTKRNGKGNPSAGLGGRVNAGFGHQGQAPADEDDVWVHGSRAEAIVLKLQFVGERLVKPIRPVAEVLGRRRKTIQRSGRVCGTDSAAGMSAAGLPDKRVGSPGHRVIGRPLHVYSHPTVVAGIEIACRSNSSHTHTRGGDAVGAAGGIVGHDDVAAVAPQGRRRKGHHHVGRRPRRDRAVAPGAAETARITDVAHRQGGVASVADHEGGCGRGAGHDVAEGQVAAQGDNPRGGDYADARDSDAVGASGGIAVHHDIVAVIARAGRRKGHHHVGRRPRRDRAVAPGAAETARITDVAHRQGGVAGVADQEGGGGRSTGHDDAEGQIAAQGDNPCGGNHAGARCDDGVGAAGGIVGDDDVAAVAAQGRRRKGHHHVSRRPRCDRAVAPGPAEAARITDVAHRQGGVAGVADHEGGRRGGTRHHVAKRQVAAQGDNPRGSNDAVARGRDGVGAAGGIVGDDDVAPVTAHGRRRKSHRHVGHRPRGDRAVAPSAAETARIGDTTHRQSGIARAADHKGGCGRGARDDIAERQVAAHADGATDRLQHARAAGGIDGRDLVASEWPVVDGNLVQQAIVPPVAPAVAKCLRREYATLRAAEAGADPQAIDEQTRAPVGISHRNVCPVGHRQVGHQQGRNVTFRVLKNGNAVGSDRDTRAGQTCAAQTAPSWIDGVALPAGACGAPIGLHRGAAARGRPGPEHHGEIVRNPLQIGGGRSNTRARSIEAEGLPHLAGGIDHPVGEHGVIGSG